MSRADVYAEPTRAGRPLSDGPLTRLTTWLKLTLSSELQRRERAVEESLAPAPTGTRPNMPVPRSRITTCRTARGSQAAGCRGRGERRQRPEVGVASSATTRARSARRATIRYDDRVRVMRDTGTYSLSELKPGTRVPVKELGAAIAFKFR